MTVGKPPRLLHVLVVDDSAVVRETLAAILSHEPDMRVMVASDPIFAMQKMKSFRPDVIVLDLEMPRMDGITFLRKLSAEQPIPVVVCSALTGGDAEAAVRALSEGAVSIVTKSNLAVRDFLQESATVLVDAVRDAAAARVLPRTGMNAARPPCGPAPLRITTDKVIAVGASTGGTEAIRALLEAMPEDAPGLVIVQHMPEIFTAAFAVGLHQTCNIEVKEARSGDRVVRGRALIAQGNRHLVVKRDGAHYAVETHNGPLVSRHRPSVDVLFRSVADAVGPNAVGVLLTGMGSDGADGLLAMKRAGAPTIAQDEASSVVFGMPREAILRGAVDEVLPLGLIPLAILGRVTSRS